MNRSFLFALVTVVLLFIGALQLLSKPRAASALEPPVLSADVGESEPLDGFTLVGVRESVAEVAASSTARRAVPLNDLELADFTACYEAQDETCCRDFIMDWFQFPSAGVDRMLSLLPGLTDGADARTLALLLQSAMVLMEQEPGSFAPWSESSLIATTVSLADENEFMSRVLLEGLSRFGQAAHAEDFDTILSLYSGAAEHADFSTQVDQLRLLGAWVQDLRQEEIGRFEATYASQEITETSYLGMGARLLVERDVESGLEFVSQATEQACAEYSPEDPFVLAVKNHVNIGLSAAYGPEKPEKRAELVAGLAAYPEQLSYYIGTMRPLELGDIQAVAEMDRFDSTTRNLFEVYAEGSNQELAALDLMQSAQFESLSSDVVAEIQMRSFTSGFKAAYNGSMQVGFQRRVSDPVGYWSRMRKLGRRFAELEQIEEAILPWIAASEGETSAYRGGLIGDLQRRFPELDWIK